jgi:3,4-dihydroxy 2-butanone 4-phosphate synthase / GTP cyclohydrolase II
MKSKNQQNFKVVGPVRLPVKLFKNKSSLFRVYFFRFLNGNFYVLEKGNVKSKKDVFIRIHSACSLAHIFHSLRCDCEIQLEHAMKTLEKIRSGLIVYIVNHEGRGVGPYDHMRAYQEQDKGFDTVESHIRLGLPVDKRKYEEIKYILKWFNIRSVKILTNNPDKINLLKHFGFKVTRISSNPKLNRYNKVQIKAKINKLGHLK